MAKQSCRLFSVAVSLSLLIVTGCALAPSPVIFELNENSLKISDHAFSSKEVSIAAATQMAQAECKKQGKDARYVSTYMPADILGVPETYQRQHLFSCN